MAVVGRSSWSSWSIWVCVVLGVWVDRAVAISVWSSLLVMSAVFYVVGVGGEVVEGVGDEEGGLGCFLSWAWWVFDSAASFRLLHCLFYDFVTVSSL